MSSGITGPSVSSLFWRNVMRRPPALVCGSYLLEAAVVTFGLLFFIVGASDIARIFHAREALRAGIRDGLRCLYPTDAGCSASGTDTFAPSQTRYEVDVWNEVATYTMPQTILSAHASWTTEPELITPLEEERVSSVAVKLARDQLKENQVLFPVRGHYPYLLQKRDLPMLGGGNPLMPEFFDRTTQQAVLPDQVVDLSSIAASTRAVTGVSATGFEPRFRVGGARFSVSDAWVDAAKDSALIRQIEREQQVAVECFSGPRAKRGSDFYIDWSVTKNPPRCSYRGGAQLFSGGELSVPIMFRVSGSTRGTSVRGQGKVLVSLRWERGRESRTQLLGGRLISAGASGNFIVRGAALEDIRVDAQRPYTPSGAYGDEIRSHGTLMLIPVNAQVFIDVYLISSNGQPVSWQGSRLELFYPSFSFVPEKFSCDFSADPEVCKGKTPVRPLYATLDPSRELRGQETSRTQCAREKPAGFEEDENEFLSRLRTRIRTGALQARPTSYWRLDPLGEGRCRPQDKRVTCAAEGRVRLKGCSECGGGETNVLPAGCSEPTFEAGRDTVEEVTCSRIAIEAVDRRRACTGDELPTCAAPHALEGNRFLLLGGSQCVRAVTHNPAPLRTAPSPTSRCGEQTGLDVEYRRMHHVPDGVPIVVESLPADDRALDTPPSDPCVVYESVLKPGPKTQCGHLASSDVASKCCADNGGRCSITPVVSGPSTGFNQSPQILLDRASERVIRTVQAAYPSARRPGSCERDAENCLQISSVHEAAAKTVMLNAEVKVPIRLASVFGATGVTVQHQELRGLEHRFSGNQPR